IYLYHFKIYRVFNVDHNDFKEELSETGNPVGIEFEDEDESTLMEPFDPEKISIEQRVVAMETVIRRLKQGLINLSPAYQRNEVWDDTRRSRLIESLMLKIPLPMFYVAASDNGSWEVVDGLQRLSTIKKFIIEKSQNRLVLKNLEFLGDKFDKHDYTALEGQADYPKYLNNLLETELRFTVINPSTPEAVKRNIFKRINTGGMPLTLQEIRNALYQGKSTELLFELANSPEFLNTIKTKVNDTRMAARELTLRFIAFNLFSYNVYPSFTLDTWLTSSMQAINLMPLSNDSDINLKKIEEKIGSTLTQSIKVYNVEQLRQNFTLAMQRAEIIFGKYAFRKIGTNSSKIAPINRYLFESWSNILVDLSEDDFNKLLDEKELFEENLNKLNTNFSYVNSIGKYASQGKYVLYRYKILSYLIRETIDSNIISLDSNEWTV
ncbi:DUF262 domain-containing protein, partial [Acinetobacter lwoffii]|uniref:DUF262 domain-containing protein n=1 Tax=Acinetobacter lwoffii TaxID=28090 RepID=UPI0032B58DA8